MGPVADCREEIISGQRNGQRDHEHQVGAEGLESQNAEENCEYGERSEGKQLVHRRDPFIMPGQPMCTAIVLSAATGHRHRADQRAERRSADRWKR